MLAIIELLVLDFLYVLLFCGD